MPCTNMHSFKMYKVITNDVFVMWISLSTDVYRIAASAFDYAKIINIGHAFTKKKKYTDDMSR